MAPNPNPTAEMIEAIRAMIEEFELDGKILDDIARAHKAYFDALGRAGFTENQAIQIVTALPLPL